MIANLSLSLMLTGAIASGGVNSTTTFNNAKTDPPIVVTTNYNYESRMSYSDSFIGDDNYIYEVMCQKYEGTTTQHTLYGLIQSYSYSYGTYRKVLDNVTQLYSYALVKAKNITFYKIILYEGAQNSTYNMYYSYRFTYSHPITMIGDLTLYEFNNFGDIDQYLNQTNLMNIYNYDPTTQCQTLWNENYITMLNNQVTNDSQPFDFGQFINGTIMPQSFCIITESTNNIGYAFSEGMDTLYTGIQPKNLNISYTAIPFNYNVVDIPGLMLFILTLPFSFISQAFQPITLFPNTPYSINIGNLILVILTTMIIIWIIKKVVRLR